MSKGYRIIPAKASADTKQPVTCQCGSPDFDEIKRARLYYDRLDPQRRAILEPAAAFACAKCGAPLEFTKRAKEIAEGQDKGVVTG